MHYQSYAIIGTGALGGFYGASLHRAGADVHFLLRSDFDHVRTHGLQIESVNGDFTLPEVNAYRSPQDMPPCDVVLLTLKATQNHLLPELLPPVLKEDGFVLVLQNGLGVDEEVAAVAGPERVVGGLCFICSHKTGPGHICHLDYGRITLGEYSSTQTPAGITGRLRRLGADLEQAGIPIVLTEDLLAARWKKLVWNIPFNGLSVVLDAYTNEMVSDEHIRAVITTLMEEVLAAAAAVHQRHIPAEFIQQMFEATLKMKPYHTSMKLDYNAGRPMELEAIYGVPLALAQQAGLELPHIDMLYRQLKFLDTRKR